LPQQRNTTDLDGATPRHRPSSKFSPLSPSATCVQESAHAISHPVVSPSELTQVTDLLAFFTGVTSRTPAAVWTWPTPLNTPSSATRLVVSRVSTVLALTQSLNHVLGGPAAPSRHMSAVSVAIAPLEKSHCHGVSDNKPLSPQGAKGNEAIEIDDNDLVTCRTALNYTILGMTYPTRQSCRMTMTCSGRVTRCRRPCRTDL